VVYRRTSPAKLARNGLGLGPGQSWKTYPPDIGGFEHPNGKVFVAGSGQTRSLSSSKDTSEQAFTPLTCTVPIVLPMNYPGLSTTHNCSESYLEQTTIVAGLFKVLEAGH